MRTAVVVVLLSLTCAACSTTYTGLEVDSLMTQAMTQAEARHAANERFQAVYMAHMVSRVDPDYPGAAEILADLPPWMEDYIHRPILGSNVAVREPVRRAWWARVLWYLPDRVLDLLDVFSFDLHLGVGAFVDVHVTRVLQAQLGGRSVAGFGWHDHRSLGVQTQAQAGFALVALGAEGYGAAQVGTSGARSGSWHISGLHGTRDDLYQEYRDYWAIGAAVTAGVAGVDVDIHPMEIVDFLVGWITFDPHNDDFGESSGLELGEIEEQIAKSLAKVAASEESVQNYIVYRGAKVEDAQE